MDDLWAVAGPVRDHTKEFAHINIMSGFFRCLTSCRRDGTLLRLQLPFRKDPAVVLAALDHCNPRLGSGSDYNTPRRQYRRPCHRSLVVSMDRTESLKRQCREAAVNGSLTTRAGFVEMSHWRRLAAAYSGRRVVDHVIMPLEHARPLPDFASLIRATEPAGRCAPYSFPPLTLAQVSRRPTVRLNTRRPGAESSSRRK